MKTLFSNKRKYKYQLFIALHGADLVELEGSSDTLGFAVSTSTHLFDVYADTPEQKVVWMEKLNDAIVKLRNSERFYEGNNNACTYTNKGGISLYGDSLLIRQI